MARQSAQSGRIRPLDALRGIRGLLRDPDDTEKVFDIIDALSGRSLERTFGRFRRTETGARLLAEQPDLVAVLSDRDRLLAMPAGTLGRAYGEFVSREQISADGLIEASERIAERDPSIPEDRYWFGGRLRDMHDLWHVVTGYNRDLVGEASLLAFSYAQIQNPGIGFIVLVAYLRAGSKDIRWARPMIRDGYERGKRAEWLPSQDWEALLSKPLEEVRRDLCVGVPPQYEEVRSEGAPALA
ncbi:MAG: Coq4 family protein [Candidatus Binatia bacterium]|nr:Coq4 family protein [Candidatus Binatia bacterium]